MVQVVLCLSRRSLMVFQMRATYMDQTPAGEVARLAVEGVVKVITLMTILELEAGREASMILMTHQELEVEREVSMTLSMIPQDPAAGEAVN